MPRKPQVASAVLAEIERIAHWYLTTAYGRWEGPGTVPYYADAARIGSFAADLDALAARDPATLFKLLITMGSYQSRRDVDIMKIQRTMRPSRARELTSPRRLHVLLEGASCVHLGGPDDFDQRCDVRRDLERGTATCATRPRTHCHVKDATMAIGRMGDLGKMSTSAFLRIGPDGLGRWFDEACAWSADPHARATWLVERIATIYRIGRKLASMFVTALSVVELAGVAPWSPEVDGSRIVVVDANVLSAIRIWRHDRGAKTYQATTSWLVAAADQIDLSQLRNGLPSRSPRLVQQAIFLFRSRSNRTALGDECARSACVSCPSRVCPFRDRTA